MKLHLTDAEKAQILPQIQAVLDGGPDWDAPDLHQPVEAIVEAILSIPGVERQPLEDPEYGIVGFSTNGWQWDWWQEFKHNGKRFTLAGSGYYGGLNFHVSDSES